MRPQSPLLLRAVALLAGCLAASAQAQEGFKRTVAATDGGTQVCVTWAHRTLLYRLDTAGSERTPGRTEFDAVQAAFDSWQALSNGCSDFTFRRGADITQPSIGRGTINDNVVTFRERLCGDVVPAGDRCYSDHTCENTYRCWDQGDGVIAMTFTNYSPRTGVVTDADTEFNAANFLLTTVDAPACDEGRPDPTCIAFDVQAVMTHEIGHMVGFDHVFTDSSSLMFPTAPMGERSKRVIDPWTAAAFCTVYPKGQPPQPCDPAQDQDRVVLANTTCAVAGGAPGWLALVATLGLWARRARRAPA